MGQAEWIKFIGLLLGVEKEGNERFAAIEKRYNELKELTADGKVKNVRSFLVASYGVETGMP